MISEQIHLFYREMLSESFDVPLVLKHWLYKHQLWMKFLLDYLTLIITPNTSSSLHYDLFICSKVNRINVFQERVSEFLRWALLVGINEMKYPTRIRQLMQFIDLYVKMFNPMNNKKIYANTILTRLLNENVFLSY